jgi:hypothetical protein
MDDGGIGGLGGVVIVIGRTVIDCRYDYRLIMMVLLRPVVVFLENS